MSCANRAGALGAGLIAAAMGLAAPAAADDQDTCRNERGPVAIAACTRLIDSGRYATKDRAAFYNIRAIKRRLENDFDGAITDYTQSIALDPQAATYSNRGNSRRLKNDLDGALADFSEALRLNPRYAAAVHNRGLVLWEKKDYDAAIRDMDTAIALEPDYTAAYTNRGLLYEIKGDRERARADFNKALSLPEGRYTDGRWARERARESLSKLDQ